MEFSARLVNDEHRIVYHASSCSLRGSSSTITDTRTAKTIGKNKELFLDYGEGYWAEGSFENYLAEREEGGNSAEEAEQEVGWDDPNFTYGSDAAEGS